MAAAASLRMPKLGLTMTEAMLASWAVKVGDRVKAGDILYTIETDKIATDVEAQGDGEILSLSAVEGETYAVGAVLGEWTGASPELAMAGPENGTEAEPETGAEAAVVGIAALPVPAKREDSARIVATPLARRIAREASLDLSGVSGSGENGRIKARDVEAAAQSAVAPSPEAGASREIEALTAQPASADPQFSVIAHVDVGKLGALRDELNASGNGRANIEVTHMIIAAVSRAMIDTPDANAVWNQDAVLRYPDIDVAIVEGASAPVLRDAARSTLRNIVDRSEALLQRASDGVLTDEEARGAAIAIVDGGGAMMLVPGLSAGRSSTLGIGGVELVFRPDSEGKPKLCEELNLVLTCDARVWNGPRAARFLDRMRDLLENPLHLLL